MTLSGFLLILLKGSLISAFLFAYYWAFLRNARFHLYNRWYLLVAILFSLAIPFLRIPLPAIWDGPVHQTTVQPGMIRATGQGGIPSGNAQVRPDFWQILSRYSALIVYTYLTISCFLLTRLLLSLFSLYRLSRRCPTVIMDGIRFHKTREPDAPFSFFSHLFWDEDIRLDTDKGRTVLRHELYHIRQGHSFDILALETVQCFFWCNPFIHLMLRELKLVHEFLADRHALPSGDRDTTQTSGEKLRTAYAEWLVWQSIRKPRHSSLTHSFYHTNLKRRISMIMQSDSNRRSALRRAMALPLCLFLFGAFTGTSSHSPAPATAVKSTRSRQVTPDTTLFRFYLRHLRYPENARTRGEEQTVWFSIRIGANNQLLEFRDYGSAPAGENATEIVVTAYADANVPIHDGGPTAQKPFIEEARKTSEKIPADTGKAYSPGEYLFSIRFKLEKSQ
jgi:hypothetical protein